MKSIGVVNFSAKPGSVELQEIEYPLFGDDDVIMQVEAVSVCEIGRASCRERVYACV